MLTFCKQICLSIVIFAGTFAHAGPLAVDLDELRALLDEQRDKVIFVDVRDPVEIMFTGFTDSVDANIPFRLVDPGTWNSEKGVFMMRLNGKFLSELDALLLQKNLSKDAIIVTMCRSGSARGKPSAEYLRQNGYEGARYLVHGFQGAKAKDGQYQGLRVVNGWQNSGLPWQSKANPEKIYRR